MTQTSKIWIGRLLFMNTTQRRHKVHTRHMLVTLIWRPWCPHDAQCRW